MKTYGQLCGVAKALDVIGDRWTLLIVRELLIRGPVRYTDVKNGLPGIASNLLAGRLRELERAGVIAATHAPPPVATTVYELTSRGRELEPVLEALGRWGGSLLSPSDEVAFRSHWLALPLRSHLAADGPPVRVQVQTGDEPLAIVRDDDGIDVASGALEDPDAVVAGEPWPVLSLLLGRISHQEAARHGVRVRGDAAALERLHAAAPAAA